MSTTVDQAVEAGARALFAEERNESMGDVPWPEYDSDDNVGRPIFEEHSRSAIAAAWPVLSAGLRRLHTRWDQGGGWAVCMHCNDNTSLPRKKRWPCETIAELDRIDQELGIGGAS